MGADLREGLVALEAFQQSNNIDRCKGENRLTCFSFKHYGHLSYFARQ
jgi:hypothetical protein